MFWVSLDGFFFEGMQLIVVEGLVRTAVIGLNLLSLCSIGGWGGVKERSRCSNLITGGSGGGVHICIIGQ